MCSFLWNITSIKYYENFKKFLIMLMGNLNQDLYLVRTSKEETHLEETNCDV